MTTSEEERAAFHKWATEGGCHESTLAYNYALEGWLASARTHTARAPDPLTNKERGELEIRRDWMSRNPFCPDHRDKVQGLSCRQCEIERLTRLSNTARAPQPEPVAWRCKDYADGWILYQFEHNARRYQEETGCLMQPLYAARASAERPEAVGVWHEFSGERGRNEGFPGWVIVRWDDDTEQNVCGRFSVLEPREGFHSQFATHWAMFYPPAETQIEEGEA
jgi:hypothetical protein